MDVYSRWLNSCEYKTIKQIAKDLNLPCNMKKKHLKDLILAKKFKTQEELDKVRHHIGYQRNLDRGSTKKRCIMIRPSLKHNQEHRRYRRIAKPLQKSDEPTFTLTNLTCHNGGQVKVLKTFKTNKNAGIMTNQSNNATGYEHNVPGGSRPGVFEFVEIPSYHGSHIAKGLQNNINVCTAKTAATIMSHQPIQHNISKIMSRSDQLEHLYNFRKVCLLKKPLHKLVKTSTTKYVLNATDQTSLIIPTLQTRTSFTNVYSTVTCSSELLVTGRDSEENLDTKGRQLVDVPVTGKRDLIIFNMYYDALELISQDGNYMERIRMDVRRQCLLCPWNGAESIIETHYRKEHFCNIETQFKNEWIIKFTVNNAIEFVPEKSIELKEITDIKKGDLQCVEKTKKFVKNVSSDGLCRRRLIDDGEHLYVLTAKYEDPDIFLVSLNSLMKNEGGRKFVKIMTKVADKINYMWEGPIKELFVTLQNSPEKEIDCFKIKLPLMVPAPDHNAQSAELVNNLQVSLYIKLYTL